MRGSTLLLYRLRCSHKESTSADQVKADIDFLRCTAALTIVACLCFSEIVGYQQGDLRHGLPTMMICHPDSNSSSGPVNGGRPPPRVLLLDEPSLGLPPRLITEVMGLIAEMRDRGLSVLLIEQNARAALKIADRGYVMEGGRMIMDGSVDRLLSDGRVRSAYLGEKTT